jgi:hypothetical protein
VARAMLTLEPTPELIHSAGSEAFKEIESLCQWEP